jgi:hypothetical protein
VDREKPMPISMAAWKKPGTWRRTGRAKEQGAKQGGEVVAHPTADPTDGPYGQGVRPVNQREPEQARVPTARGDGALELERVPCTLMPHAPPAGSKMRRPPGRPLACRCTFLSAQRISALHSTSRTGVDDTTATQHRPAGADLPASGPPWPPGLLVDACCWLSHTRTQVPRTSSTKGSSRKLG